MIRRNRTVKRHFGPLESETTTRGPAPFLKWAGGKSKLLAHMSCHFPKDYGKYVEPFLGGGAVFFHLRPRKAVLSDSNPELVNAFEVVRDNPEELMSALDTHYSHRKNRDYYNGIRAQNPAELSQVDRATRTVFLNKTCYNGLYRVNSKGQFNVPFGRYSNPSLYDRDNILADSETLQGKILIHDDYRRVCRRARGHDFVYLDPPYHPLSATSSFTGYTKDSFDEDDQVRLAATFRAMDARGCRVMLSNSSTPLIRELYEGFTIITLRAARAISCKGNGRGKIEEVLVMNY